MIPFGASASSSLDFGVQSFQFSAGVADFELPVDTALLGVGFLRPSADFCLQHFHVTESPVPETLPAAVFRRIAEVDPADIAAGEVWLKGFVERADGVRVQVVTNQCHSFTARIAGIQLGRHFHGPIRLRAAGTGRGLAKTGEWLGKPEDACRPGPFVFVIDTLRMLRCGGD